MQPAATFLNYVYAIHTTLSFKWIDAPHIANCSLAPLEPAAIIGMVL